jgi:hypothetical protein
LSDALWRVELLGRRAELVHVAARRHRVLRDQRVAERRVELHRAPRAEGEVRAAALRLQVGPGGRSVDEDHDVRVTGLDRGGRVLDHELPGRPADARAVDPRGPQPEVLGDLDRCEQPGAARAEPVDVVLREARVRDRTRRGLVVQLERGLRVDASDVGQGGTDDRDSLVHRSFHSTRLPDSNSF